MSPWLAVVGIGEDGLAGLGERARARIAGASFLAGDERVLAMIPEDGRERLPWPRPMSAALPAILEKKPRPVCILASGDPMHYGIGEMLIEHLPIAEMEILPAPSSLSLACARLGWSRKTVEIASAHSRPVEHLAGVLAPGARLLILTRNGRTPGEIAAFLAARGYGESRVWVLERLGGARERLLAGKAGDWPHQAVDDLNIVAVECVAGTGTALHSRAAGLPDEAYLHDGMLTKREVRAATLAALAPFPGQVLWDVGAGSGSISIEWLRLAPGGQAFAIEAVAERSERIAANAAIFGTQGLSIVAGRAPAVLAGLPRPDAVFIGGGLGAAGLLGACWAALAPGGRLVANAVTLEGEASLASAQQKFGGEMVRIAVWRAAPVGSLSGWKALMPVTQWSATRS